MAAVVRFLTFFVLDRQQNAHSWTFVKKTIRTSLAFNVQTLQVFIHISTTEHGAFPLKYSGLCKDASQPL